VEGVSEFIIKLQLLFAFRLTGDCSSKEQIVSTFLLLNRLLCLMCGKYLSQRLLFPFLIHWGKRKQEAIPSLYFGIHSAGKNLEYRRGI